MSGGHPRIRDHDFIGCQFRERIRQSRLAQVFDSMEDVTAPSSLTPQFRGRDVCRPGDADGAFVVLLAMAQAHVDTAAEEIFVERVGPFVHRMAGDRGDRAALLGQQPASSSSALPRHRARNQVRS